MIAILPAALALSVEMTFPMNPAIVNGLMMLLVQVSGFVTSLTFSEVLDVKEEDFTSKDELTETR